MVRHWIATWTASPMNVWAADAVLPGLYNQTIREVVRVSLGGSSVRIRLSNEFGSAPIEIEAASIALAGEAGTVHPSTGCTVIFGGNAKATIPPGSPLLSDAVDFRMPPLTRIAVSLYVKGYMQVQTHHYEAQQTTFLSIPGNFVSSERMPIEQTTTSRHLISAVFVETPEKARAIVCFGDSITDGYGSTVDGDNRWPDILAERLQATPGFEGVAVLNHGLGGNRLLHNGRGVKALERFDRDVLSLSGVSHLVILEGINDIGWPKTVLAGADQVVSVDQIVAGLKQLVARAQIAGIKVILGTITPFEGAMSDTSLKTLYTAEKEKIRQAVNAWIRESGECDGVVDFDLALRDPLRPTRLLSAFDCGDHLHPNDAGYRAMGQVLDLSTLILKSV
jgi:lysophospholipase L1-like esterase